jgi:SAM-dependent methyltransferase
MKMMSCRLCHSKSIQKIVNLGLHPLADTFIPPEYADDPERAFPLELGLCNDCGHVFSLYVISPEERYQKYDYSYDSSNSKVAINHFNEFCQTVLSTAHPKPEALVVDIGSNVGTLLSQFVSSGYPNVQGVDPSGNICKIANEAGIPTIHDFFCKSSVEMMRGKGKAELILSSNVLNHVDDFDALLENVNLLLSETGSLVFEVPYLLDLVKDTSFDTIYHEHSHYFGLEPLSIRLGHSGLFIYKVERNRYMGGSIRVYARKSTMHAPIVNEMIAAEQAFGLYTASTYSKFMDRVRKVKYAVNTYLWKIKSEGGKIVGIGAATKGNTLLNYCRIDADLISFITDASPLKIGKLAPGSRIPIASDADIDSSVTHALILPWNIADFLKSKLSHLKVEFYSPQVETI